MKYLQILLSCLLFSVANAQSDSSQEMTFTMEGDYCVIQNSRGDVQMKGKLIDGKKEEIWTLWDSEGTKIGDLSYRNNQLDGTVKLHYSKFSYPKFAGNIKAEMNFKNGIRDGQSIYYNPNGDLLITFKTENGKPKTNFLNKKEILGRIESDSKYFEIIEEVISETINQ